MWSIAVSAGLPLVVAVVSVAITYIFTKKKEHEAEWRRLKFDQYQELIISMSGIVSSRATPEAQGRYADAVNSMQLIAPAAVLAALHAFQAEISFRNNIRSQEEHDRYLRTLFQALRHDIHPRLSRGDQRISFRLFDVPPAKVKAGSVGAD